MPSLQGGYGAGVNLPFALASELQPGTYVVLRTRSFFGAVIRFFCRSQWDHAVLVTGPGEITQATLRGVKTGPLSQFSGCLAVANSAEDMTPAQRRNAATFMKALDRDEYAFALLPVIALRLAGVKWSWLIRLTQDRDAVICSEAVAQAGQHIGKDWLCGEPSAAAVQPCELAGRRPFMRSVVWDLAGQ